LALPYVLAENIYSTSLLAFHAVRDHRDQLNQHQSPRITLPISFASPYQYQNIASCIPGLPYSPLTSLRRPNRQLEAQTAHRPASTFTKIMAINYLGIMIGFPALLAFALTTLGIRYFFVKREMRNIRTRARDGDEPGS